MVSTLQEQNRIECCFGCGSKNSQGLHIESYRSDDGAVCIWQASPHHCGGRPEYVYGGVIASLIDCHSVNLAMNEAYRSENREPGSEPLLHYVTGSLQVSYIKPCPTDKALHVKAKLIESKGRKSWVESEITCKGIVCARGKVIAVRVNSNFRPGLNDH